MKGNVLLSLGAVVSIVAAGCGGSASTNENPAEQVSYQNATITRNADSSLTISDSQRTTQFSTLKYDDQRPVKASLAVACTCSSCGCSGGTCICTGCSGDCP